MSVSSMKPCHCDAYPFPHRLGGGRCDADEPQDEDCDPLTKEEYEAEENRYLDRQNAREINRKYG